MDGGRTCVLHHQECWQLEFTASCLSRLASMFRVAQMEVELHCIKHPERGLVGCALPINVDLFVACAPCQPYSMQRNGVGATSPEQHPSYSSLWGAEGSVLSLLSRVKPQVLITENVTGFDSNDRKRQLIEAVLAVKDDKEAPGFCSGSLLQARLEEMDQWLRPQAQHSRQRPEHLFLMVHAFAHNGPVPFSNLCQTKGFFPTSMISESNATSCILPLLLP